MQHTNTIRAIIKTISVKYSEKKNDVSNLIFFFTFATLKCNRAEQFGQFEQYCNNYIKFDGKWHRSVCRLVI